MSRPHTSTNILLLLLWLFIMGAIAWQWINPPTLESIATTGKEIDNGAAIADITAKPVNSFAIASLDDYQEIVERPLFYETRRPPSPEVPEVAVQEEPEEEPPVALTLIGVMVTPDAKVALVQNDDTSKVERLKLGDEIGGWEVQYIDSDNVIINKSNETKELALLRNKRKPTLKTTLRQELQQRRSQRQRRIENQQQQDGEQQETDSEQEPEEQNSNEEDSDQAAMDSGSDDANTATQSNKAQRAERTARKKGDAAERDRTQSQ